MFVVVLAVAFANARAQTNISSSPGTVPPPYSNPSSGLSNGLFQSPPSSPSFFAQQGPKLVGPGVEGRGAQGQAVALSADGNTAIVGGTQDGYTNQGAAWVWTRTNGAWIQQGPKLAAADAIGNSYQGSAVALSADGNTALVGGKYDDHFKGATWVWVRNGDRWTEQAKLVFPGIREQGLDVALSGDGNTAMVVGREPFYDAVRVWTRAGTTWTPSNRLAGFSSWQGQLTVAISSDGSTAVVGDIYDDNVGAAFVYTKQGNNWTQQGPKLVGGYSGTYPDQGSSVAISDDGSAIVVGGRQENASIGAAWVWRRSSGVWSESAKLVGAGSLGQSQQGRCVSISGDGHTVVVAGPSDAVGTGAAWVWVDRGGSWVEFPKLVGVGAVGPAYQGQSVALSGDGVTVMVGGPSDSVAAGAAWAWMFDGTIWRQQGPKLVGIGTSGASNQGSSVATSSDGSTLVVGGPGDAGGLGAVWVWKRVLGSWTRDGAKLVGTGYAGLAAQGTSVAVSADGNTLAVGGANDNGGAGAVWLWVRQQNGVWSQQGAKVVGAGATTPAHQGYAVSLSDDGNTLLVGGPTDGECCYDVRGTGAAWVWTRAGSTWTQQGAKLSGSGVLYEEVYQGRSVALSGDGNTAIVGGPSDHNHGTYTGAAWVWRRSAAGIWNQQGPKLVAPGPAYGQQGRAVALSRDGLTAAVGSVGGAWIWTQSLGGWARQGSVVFGSGASSGASQGVSVSLSADGARLLVGADKDAAGTGAAWAFTRAGGVWSQDGAKLVGAGATSPLGVSRAVALSADGLTAVLGGYGDGDGLGATWVFDAGIAPSILAPPSNQQTIEGGSAAFAPVVAGSMPVGVQWQVSDTGGTSWSNLQDLPPYTGATSPTLTLTGVPITFAGARYRLVATSSRGTATSASALLTVMPVSQTTLIHDGDFGDEGRWRAFATPDLSYIVSRVLSSAADSPLTNGVLAFYRKPPPAGTTNQAGVYQETGAALPSMAPLRARLSLANGTTMRKRITIALADHDFSDVSFCTFWLAPGSRAATYEMRTHTTQAWENAALYFYAETAGVNEYYLVDDVSLQYDPNGSSVRTDCVDPTTPLASAGPDGPSLLTNGDFSAGLTPWATSGSITAQVNNGVFEFIHPSAAPPATVTQSTSQVLATHDIVTAQFLVGNSSSVRKRVTVEVHDQDHSDLIACTFWLPPGQPLSLYAMRGFSTMSWSNATISIYGDTVGADEWSRLDGVTLQRTPGAVIVGTECAEPGATPLRTTGLTPARSNGILRLPAAATRSGEAPMTHSPAMNPKDEPTNIRRFR